MKLVVACMAVATTHVAFAESRPKAPPATTPIALPDGLKLAPFVKLPTTPGFKPRAANWWKKKQPCPKGAKLSREKIDSRLHGVVCREKGDKQHGPGLAMWEGDKPYEDSWSEHGKENGTRWTWMADGTLDHTESFVMGVLQGPAEEWSGGHKLREGAYLDGKKHGEWTDYMPTKLVLHGTYDRGTSVGTWIGTREGVATAIVVGEMGTGSGTRTWRIFDASGALTFERVLTDDGETASGWSAKGVRIAEYECGKDGELSAARFFDDAGKLARRYTPGRYPARASLTDAKGVAVELADKERGYMDGAREACSGSIWMLEGPPPARNVALGRAP